MSTTFTLHRGRRPLLISVPHAGREIPADIAAALQPRALAVEDCDWHLERLYDFAHEIGASLIVPRHARYVVDLNRPPENTPMYPGQNNTELCPTRFFSGEPLYRDCRAPDEAEIGRRVQTYWRPYHEALQGELVRLKAEHGHAVLFDGHSIQAELPWLFDGRLPDLNLGTAAGNACAPALREHLAAVLAAQSRWSQVVDGRFKGGYITRHYGRPETGVHAVQMEMCWSCYLRDGADPAEAWDAASAADARALLRTLAETMLAWRP
ncbi:N-formylglutamate deformylase [Rubrivivax gelatinosus]|uniref:N-formylglutamate deformylase n=1 Tax=Rubrivivax gelatinosus TaxID=28068 RepID=A0ABS1DYA2_RUBGE|nr:N-formylglutamate deformylase [Rubrivivax gelatinosus]MBK1715071.1 N-formylglutamate deformylase [Rubrivivax gelatinosus]